MKKVITPFLSLILLGSHSFGAISFDIQADQLRTSGGAAAPTSTLALLIADTGNDGFGSLQAGQATSVNSVVGDTNDRVVAKFDLLGNGTAGYLGVNPSGLTYANVTGWAQGENLRLVWLPSLTSSSSSITGGTTYGAYTSSTGVDGSSAWVTPSGGLTGSTTNYKLYFFNTAGTIQAGTNAATVGNASFTVAAVPEPSRVMLLGLGLGAFIVRRRRNA